MNERPTETEDADFTMVKNVAKPPPFLQTVSKSGQATSGPKLTRVAFGCRG